MTHDEIAKLMGLTIEEVDGNWEGGPWSYLHVDYPLARICGFKTRDEAVAHAIKLQFGNNILGEKILSLLLRTPISNI